MTQLEASRPGKTDSLEKIAETNPSTEDIIVLRDNFIGVLNESDQVEKSWGIRFIWKEIGIGDRNIPITVWQPVSRKKDAEELTIEMGMRTSNNERVI